MSNIYDDIRIAPMHDLNNVLAEFYSDCANESATAPLRFDALEEALASGNPAPVSSSMGKAIPHRTIQTGSTGAANI